MAKISMQELLKAGVHFGHQTSRWNPKMKPYIFGTKHGIHVINLRKSVQQLKLAYEYAKQITEEGKQMMFVGTKPQVQEIIAEEAKRSESPYINERWLGGLLTNFNTVKKSTEKMKLFEDLAGPEGKYEGMIKKEALRMERERIKLESSLGGVKHMRSLPAALFIVDCKKERIAVAEAKKLGIPVIAMVDTNCDPKEVDIAIPGNDDAPKAVRLFTSVIASAILTGKEIRKQKSLLEEAAKTDKQNSEEFAEENNTEDNDKEAVKAETENSQIEESTGESTVQTNEEETKETSVIE